MTKQRFVGIILFCSPALLPVLFSLYAITSFVVEQFAGNHDTGIAVFVGMTIRISIPIVMLLSVVAFFLGIILVATDIYRENTETKKK